MTTTEFFSTFPKVFLPKKTVLLSPDSVPEDVFFLLSGYLRVFTLTPAGQEISLLLAQPGSFMPMWLVLTKTPSKYFIEALTDATAHKVPAHQALSFLKANPEELFELTTSLAAGINNLLERAVSLSAGTSEENIQEIKDFLEKSLHDLKPAELKSNLSDRKIASWLGLSRETVTRRKTKTR